MQPSSQDPAFPAYVAAALSGVIARRNSFDDSPETIELIAKHAVALARAVALEVQRVSGEGAAERTKAPTASAPKAPKG